MSPRHLLDIDDLTKDEFSDVMARCEEPNPPQVLSGLGVGLVFEKASGRTRNATEMAVVQLGGHPVSMRGDEVGIDTRETAEDVVRALAGYHAAVGARVKRHAVLERMAAVSPIPVLNLLSDIAHPCQALADLLCLRARFGALQGLRLAFVGDFNNVARSLALASAYEGVDFVVASPPAYGPSPVDVDRVVALGGLIAVTDRPTEAVKGADAVYTDVFVSMGQESEAQQRQVAFEGFDVTTDLMTQAEERAVFLHCLPAIRGSEVDAAVIDGPQSAVFEQAAKRLDAARGALWWLKDHA
ncbi:MAG TPA: ornithine carbamoyltransferase [Acidimicrobiales bacterium]|nr:ornithine carbamoyltransferase [Acidimicrobiales bacterium]